MREGAQSHGAAAQILANGAILALVAVWAWMAKDLPAFVLPSPLAVGRLLLDFATDSSLALHLGVSFLRVGGSVLAALALGLLLAAIGRMNPVLQAVLDRRFTVFLNGFPAVGWAVLGIVWFGVSNATVMFIQVAILLPFCIVASVAAFRQIDAELVEMGRSFTRDRLRAFRLVTLPLLAPLVMAGLRTAYGVGWKIALVSELFGAQTGLGYLLMQAQASANAAMVFAVCFVIVIVFTGVDRFVLRPLALRYSINQ